MDNLAPQNAVNVGKGKFYFPDVVLSKVGKELVFIHTSSHKRLCKLSNLNAMHQHQNYQQFATTTVSVN